MMNKLDPKRLASRINAKTERAGDCLLWTGATSSGVPVMKVNGSTTTVARVVWALERYDDCPANVHRSCDNRLCVNGQHLIDANEIVEVEQVGDLNWSALTDGILAALARRSRWFANKYDWDADDVFQEACMCYAANPGAGVRAAVSAGAAVARRRTFDDEPVEFGGLFRDEGE